MISFKKFKCESIYGGNYYMDNSFKILSDNEEIGVFHFPNSDNCEIELSDNEMYLEYIKLSIKSYSKEVLKSIFEQFSVNKIFGETDDNNKSFWIHVGANVDEKYSDEFRQVYNFSLSLDKLCQ